MCFALLLLNHIIFKSGQMMEVLDFTLFIKLIFNFRTGLIHVT